MGWLCLFAIKPILINVPQISVVLLLIGGIFYTVGVIFYVWEKLPYNHALWHVFVLGGSVCHFFAVLFSV
jgi:hemolysin III